MIASCEISKKSSIPASISLFIRYVKYLFRVVFAFLTEWTPNRQSITRYLPVSVTRQCTRFSHCAIGDRASCNVTDPGNRGGFANGPSGEQSIPFVWTIGPAE